MLRTGSRATGALAVIGLAAGVALGGCEAILGTGSLEDRPAEGGTGDGTVGTEAGNDSGPDAVGQETGSDGTVSEGSAGDAKGGDATGGDATGDGDAGDAKSASDAADGGGVDSTTGEGGPTDAATESSVAEAAPEAAPTLSCGIVGADQRQVNATGATISADGLVVLNGGQANVVALAKTGSPPSLAWEIRSDRPGDAPTAFPLQGPSSAPGTLQGITQAGPGGTIYVLGSDQQNDSLLWSWPNGSNITAAPTSVTPRTPTPGGSQLAATSKGIFYAVTTNTGAYADFEVPPTAPQVITANLITTQPNGMTDGQRAYRLSDDRVSLVYTDATGQSQLQNEYAANSATLSSSRTYYAGGMIPYTFQPNGSSVDVGAVIFPADASVPSIAVATVPESQLFSFDVASTLKTVTLPQPPSNTWCVTSYPGKMVFLAPTTAGMDLLVIDVATGTLVYSLTGASNLVHSDTAIVNCAIAPVTTTGNTLTFDVIWTDNAGGGPQNLEFAPLQCTLQ